VALDYDKMIEVKKKEYEKIKDSIPVLLEERNTQIRDGNQVIFDNKEKAEKIIADANEKAGGIIAVADDIKAKAEVLADEVARRDIEVSEKEKVHIEACQAVKKDAENLAQDKIDFGRQQTEERAKTEALIVKARELVDTVASLSKTVNIKISEITKI